MNNFPSPFTIYRNTFTNIHAVTKKLTYHLTTSIPMKKEQDIIDHYFLFGWQTERKTKCVLINIRVLNKADYLHGLNV